MLISRRVFLAVWVSLFWPAASAAEDRQFTFRLPQERHFVLEAAEDAASASARPQWLRARDPKGGRSVEFGSRVVLRTRSADNLAYALNSSPLPVARRVSPDLVILEASDAVAAMNEASRLQTFPGVLSAYPVIRRSRSLHRPYASQPNDPYFSLQWNLENRHPNGTFAGADLNIRSAWPLTRGENTLIAVSDEGVELTHPELLPRAEGAPHFNFEELTANGEPVKTSQIHGTSVAGLAVAEANNQRGMAGVAPRAQLASWVVFSRTDWLVSDERVMDMFQYQSNIVTVQNHSWGAADFQQIALTALEDAGISNAVTFGRNGLGVVMIRSAGNDRGYGKDLNDDGYGNDPRVIGVAAVRSDGRAASYSNPGACVLVGAPSGDIGYRAIFTTDRRGSLGYNQSLTRYNGDYVNDLPPSGFGGTSASAPQIAGVAALIVSANPALTYRDVQQVMIHSARHVDFTDVGLATNGAGFAVSHNVGFGIPDAGQAVFLAKQWRNRPPREQFTVENTTAIEVPDAGLRLLVSGATVTPDLTNIVCIPGEGIHPTQPTATVPLVDVGLADQPIAQDLTGKAALIQRGVSLYADKIARAAQAGAVFAVIFNNSGSDEVEPMGGTSFAAIPAVMISRNAGEGLRTLLAQADPLTVQLSLEFASLEFDVQESFACEHVGVRVQSDHPRRDDLRIELVSPSGTRSVLQHINQDTFPGPVDWTYYSVQHFYENSAGTWKLVVMDEQLNNVGSVTLAGLTIYGVPMTDSDRDGLDDGWEMTEFGDLAAKPAEDPDKDGVSNIRELILGTTPTRKNEPTAIDISQWNPTTLRLSWPGEAGTEFSIGSSSGLQSGFSTFTNLPGRFPETEAFLPIDAALRFFRLEAPQGPLAR